MRRSPHPSLYILLICLVTFLSAALSARSLGPLHFIVDNGEEGTSFTGPWHTSSGSNPYGVDSLWAKGHAATYTYNFILPEAGQYEVLAWWTEFKSRSLTVPYHITHASETTVSVVNQRVDGGKWNSLGTYEFGTAASVQIEAHGDGYSYCADAVCLRKIGEPDMDDDGVPDDVDNCPEIENPDQDDLDQDGQGDTCDLDDDNDDVSDDVDNCPHTPNASQEDIDGNGTGDACDAPPADSDEDGHFDFADNCPELANPDQDDLDQDGQGDTCDEDDDGDDWADTSDNCPRTPNLDQMDADIDGVGDACDNCPDTANPGQEDSNLDGAGDACTFQEETFIRGDANSTGRVDIGDVITIVDYLYGQRAITCLIAADTNDDNRVNMADPVRLIMYIFKGSAPPAHPYPDPGLDDLTPGDLDCEGD